MRVTSALADSCRHLALAFAVDGFHFYVSRAPAASDDVHVLADGAGIIFGTLFRRPGHDADDAPSPRANLSRHDAARILESGGLDLVERYWGHYLAFMVDDPHQMKWVLRSPTCHQPCLCAAYDGVWLYFSSVDDCASLGLLRLTVNWDFIAAFSAFFRVSGTETGLNEIRELSTGEYHKLSSGAECHGFHWNPGNFARHECDDDLAESRRSLRAYVRSCIFTWAAEHTSIVQRLSGGLDSSIATACLAVAPSRPRITCLNYHAHGAYGDERKYARAVTEKTGLPLIEYAYESAVSMNSLLTYGRAHSPASYLTRIATDQREVDLATQVGATARFTGILGDVLFHMPPAAPTAADYVRRRGIDPRFFGIAHQAAQIDRISLWSVLGSALMDGLLSPPKTFLPGEFGHPDHSLLTREACDSIYHANPLRFVHPWLHSLADVPCGKFPLIASLSWNSTYFNALSAPGEPGLIHAFFSEPLVEFCLRIPTYSLLRDGWDRALAREAFGSDLPQIVKSRVSKGSPNIYVRERIAYNAPFIRDLLADGVLVNQGILDPKRVAECLPGQAKRSASSPVHLWISAAAEAWSRAWQNQAANSRRAPI